MADLSATAVLPLLRGRLGRPYTFLPSTASTQEAVPAGATEGTLVAAAVQTAGRGRLGRTWEAPPGASLLFSVVLTPHVAPERLPELTLVGARAVADALPAPTAIKYPNDVLVRGRKLAGTELDLAEPKPHDRRIAQRRRRGQQVDGAAGGIEHHHQERGAFGASDGPHLPGGPLARRLDAGALEALVRLRTHGH